jgi:hypothetical protein
MAQTMNSRFEPAEASSASNVPIADVLGRVGRELSHLAETMQQFQAVVSPLIIAAGRRDREFLHEVQDFDHIAQKLACLAAFLAALAPNTSSRWLIDPNLASQAVTLAALSSRLAGTPDADAENGAWEPGDCELF